MARVREGGPSGAAASSQQPIIVYMKREESRREGRCEARGGGDHVRGYCGHVTVSFVVKY
jgi:hypothetical protein